MHGGSVLRRLPMAVEEVVFFGVRGYGSRGHLGYFHAPFTIF